MILAQADFDSVKNVVDSMEGFKEFSEQGETVDRPEPAKESEFANDELDSKIKAYMKEHKVKYSEAFDIVVREVQ